MTRDEFEGLTIENAIVIDHGDGPFTLGILEICRGDGVIVDAWNGTHDFPDVQIADDVGVYREPSSLCDSYAGECDYGDPEDVERSF